MAYGLENVIARKFRNSHNGLENLETATMA